MFKWLSFINQRMCQLETYLLVTTLIIMLFFAFIQVILRNFFDTGIEWGDVFARHLVLWVAFFGATLSTESGLHIRIDALLKVISKRWLPVVTVFVNVFCVLVTALLTLAAYKFVYDEKVAQTTLFENIPTWYFIVIMPIGFAIITFRYFVILVESLMRFAGKGDVVDKIHNSPPEMDMEISVKVKLK